MIAAVMTIPERRSALEDLRRLIEPSVDRFLVYEDWEHRGQCWNYPRMLTGVLPQAAPDEPVLLLTDDATTVPDWRERWERIHRRAQHDIYCLFSRQRHLFTATNVARGYVKKVQLNGYYDQAVIFVNRPTLGHDVVRWFEDGGKASPGLKNRLNHYDQIVQEYLIVHQIPWVISTPTLFDHRQDVKSSLGHKIGASPFYVGTGLG